MPKNILTPNLPNYIKYFFILSSIILSLYVAIVLQSLVKPLVAAFIIALLLKPLSARMEKIKISRALSTALAMLVMIIVFAVLIFFIVFQITNITSDIETLGNSLNIAADKIVQWTSQHFGVAPNEQINYIKQALNALLKNSTSFLQNAIAATAGFLSEFFFFLIAVFFFLYYRTFLASFLVKCFSPSNYLIVHKILHSIQRMVRKYILGLALVILTTSILNSVGLLILGIKHAIFFGCFAGILTIVPYVGIVLGSLLPFLFAIATTDSIWYPLGVVMIFGFVQFLEGNFITPNVIGNQVSLNPFTALLILFINGIFFGLLGIILALPILAMTKIIFDNIDSLKPFGYLLGNPESFRKRKKSR